MSEQNKPLLMNSRLEIPFGIPDHKGDVVLSRKAAEELVQRFKETREIDIEHGGTFKILNVFLEYNLNDQDIGEIVVSGEFPIMLPRVDEGEF
ncbi:MAG TPA: hypothetical protein VHV10_05245 [Ktedonobacteraceae bacterium]|jgi:hypothetical protein|nr:hypothetical protein [Ktedonobacteraceae bacterium]